MRSPLRPLVAFLAVALSIFGGLHAYLWIRLVRDVALPAPWHRIATIALALLAISGPIMLFASRQLPERIARMLSTAAFSWMGVGFLLVVLLASFDVLRLILAAGIWSFGQESAFDASRRLFLSRVMAGTAGAAGAALGAVALRNGLGDIEVREVPIQLARLPRELSGLTIVQLTDLHIGSTAGGAFVQQIIEKTQALRPDIVCITGDLVDGSVERLGPLVAPLATLRSRYGTFFITGNHEYYSGADAWLAELSRIGIRTLRNERVSIGDAASFDLAGVDDWMANIPGHGPNLARALAGRATDRELVLLAHQPKQIHEAAQMGVGLQLSGHTHGGQIAPFGALVALTQPFIAGHHHVGSTQIYVSCGTGTWGPPMRLGAPAELTKLVLVAG